MNAEVILYADRVTNSMQQAIDETKRRRELQAAYNLEHGITPETIKKAIRRGLEDELSARQVEHKAAGVADSTYVTQELLYELEAEMLAAAEALDFERAASLRDRIAELKKQVGKHVPAGDENSPGFASSGTRSKGKKGKRGKTTRAKR